MTSIEQLIEEIENFYRKTFPDWEFPHKENWIEMHKQEIINSCKKFGNLNGVDIEDYEQYYNETFKKD